MKKVIAGAASPGDEPLQEMMCGKGITRTVLSAPVILNVSPVRPRTPSKATKARQPYIKAARALLAAGETFSDARLAEFVPSGKRSGEPLKAMRILHRDYADRTRLFLQDGLWYLGPIVCTPDCKNFECPRRLVCGGEGVDRK